MRPAAKSSGHVPSGDLVVLVHGMWRSHISMNPMVRALGREGFEVLNWDYPSRKKPVTDLGAMLADRVHEEVQGGPHNRRVHFVGHSLGNILIRWVVANRPPARLGRIVMLAPPNQGSRVADVWAPWLSWITKPIEDLTTREASAARSIATPPGVEIGIIAAAKDGKVRVAETFLEGQTDHVIVPGLHTFIMRRKDVQRLTLTFLATGRFLDTRTPLY